MVWLLIISLAGVLAVPSSICAQPKKVMLSYSSRSYVFLPAHVAVIKGFFKEEGLDALMVQMRAPVAMPALANGDIHYALAGFPTFNAIIQGLPFKFIAIMAEKSLHQLVARPGIKTVSELKGKRLGVSRIGGQDHLQAEAILEAKGVDPGEVKLVNLGAEEPVRAEILRQGLVDAICVSAPHPLRLRKDGYQVLGGPGDLKQAAPSAGVATTDLRVKSERDETKKVLRAIVRGLRFTRESREETISIMMQWLGQSSEVAAESYDLVAPLLSPDGVTSDANIQYAVEAVKKTVGSAKPVPLSQIRDFSILRELQKELGLRR